MLLYLWQYTLLRILCKKLPRRGWQMQHWPQAVPITRNLNLCGADCGQSDSILAHDNPMPYTSTTRLNTTTSNDTTHGRRSLQSAAANRQPLAHRIRLRSRLMDPAPSTTAPARGTQPSRGSGMSSTVRNAGHFQGSRNVAIHDGEFLNTLGHHTNLVVNLNQTGYVPSGGEDLPSQGSHPGANATGDDDRLNELRNRNMQAVMQLPVQRSNEIYERHLLLKGRGFPLWIPEPNKNLSMIYQRQGISIGDVGLVTYAGSFSFLFNICLPADHPVNPRVMPEGFAPIDPPIDPGDVRRFTEFKAGSFLGSNSIIKSLEPYENQLSFEAQSSEGAILVMPEGAVSYDFENIPSFRKYIAANLESWYRYANGLRGREAKNGDIRVVIGCDKSTSWGMAAMSNLSEERNSRLTLLSKKTEPTDSQNPQPVGYTWEYSGVAEVRAGPDPEEIEELRVDDPEPSIKYANQSLFIRTLNPTLGSELWEKVNRDLGLADLSNVRTEQDSDSVNLATQQNMDSQSAPSNTNSRHTNHPRRRHASSIPDDLQEDISRKEDNVSSSLTPELKDRFHPSIGLNRFLSETYPHARMIITEDRDWYSVIKEDETELPPGHELYRRALDISDVEYDDSDGILYLKPTREPVRNLRNSEEEADEEVSAMEWVGNEEEEEEEEEEWSIEKWEEAVNAPAGATLAESASGMIMPKLTGSSSSKKRRRSFPSVSSSSTTHFISHSTSGSDAEGGDEKRVERQVWDNMKGEEEHVMRKAWEMMNFIKRYDEEMKKRDEMVKTIEIIMKALDEMMERDAWGRERDAWEMMKRREEEMTKKHEEERKIFEEEMMKRHEEVMKRHEEEMKRFEEEMMKRHDEMMKRHEEEMQRFEEELTKRYEEMRQMDKEA
ncbi:hypothetical protein D9613_006180 [Agrocybe pediades]|uniref:Uncharacterized protein n=1 Tax=Agrocybe pediades TaxID=84607 RepID=A0A8H4QUV2_9AGAR|nr:hypothetical protein D9613_006180 [Agrocybe pediades]